MQGLTVFRNLHEALNAGYYVYDRTPTGYVMRLHTAAGWALAIVEPGK